MEVDNRIWDGNDGLTFSTITDLLSEPETAKDDLKNLILDLTDNVFEAEKERDAILKRLEIVERRIQFLNGNLSSCIKHGQRNFEFPDHVFYIHDRENKTVAVEFTDGKIIISEQYLTR